MGKSLHTEFGPLLSVPQCLNPCTRGALKELLNCTQQTELNVQSLGLAFLQLEGWVVWPLPASVSFREKLPPCFPKTHPQEPPAGAPITPKALTLNRGSPCPPRQVAQGSELSGLITSSKQLNRAKEAGALPVGWRSAGAAEENVGKHPTTVSAALKQCTGFPAALLQRKSDQKDVKGASGVTGKVRAKQGPAEGSHSPMETQSRWNTGG